MLKGLLGDLMTPEIEKALEGKQIAIVNDGSYLPRDKYNAVANEAKELKKQLAERDTQLEALKGTAAGNADLLKQIDDLKAANDKTKATYEAQLKQQAKDYAIDRAIAEAKGKNPKAIKALLNLEAINLDGDNVLGLTEQIEAIKGSDTYLFDNGQAPPLGGGTNPPGGGNKPPDIQEQWQEAMKKGDVSLAIALKNKLFGG